MDLTVFYFLNHLTGQSASLDLLWRFLALYLIWSIPLFLMIDWFLGPKKIALRATLAGLLAWQGLGRLIGYLYFRPRPMTILPIQEVIFHRPTYSFPSDHAALLFALAFSFWLANQKRTSYWLWTIGVIISISRVITGLHYPSDILAGWVLGIIVAWLVWILKEPIDKWIIGPLIWVARRIRLA